MTTRHVGPEILSKICFQSFKLNIRGRGNMALLNQEKGELFYFGNYNLNNNMCCFLSTISLEDVEIHVKQLQKYTKRTKDAKVLDPDWFVAIKRQS